MASCAYQEGKSQLLPGTHYQVLEEHSAVDEYWTFPREPSSVFKHFRHTWVIVRRRRPFVPVLEGATVPSPSKPPLENAKYLSLFFRPWTFQQAKGSFAARPARATPFSVPHIASLGLQHLQESSTSAAGKTVSETSNFVAPWKAFLQGGVHSQEAAQLIQTLLTNVMVVPEHEQPE